MCWTKDKLSMIYQIEIEVRRDDARKGEGHH
jgi:hypothetical protein